MEGNSLRCQELREVSRGRAPAAGARRPAASAARTSNSSAKYGEMAELLMKFSAICQETPANIFGIPEKSSKFDQSL